MKELDILEKEILKAIDKCSVFEIRIIRQVYERCNSFDKTISVLKYSVEHAISIEQSMEKLL